MIDDGFSDTPRILLCLGFALVSMESQGAQAN